MAKVLLFGAAGQLGLALQRAKLPDQWTLIPLSRAEVDVADPEMISAAITEYKPDAVINAAAYTAVDKAESEPRLAFTLNRDAPALMARQTAARGIALLHVSTDYVFSGEKPGPYVESDPLDPINVYGRSKAEGETAVLHADPGATIVRTSWVFSADRANFLKSMLRIGESADQVSVVNDQWGRPTFADELARAFLALTQTRLNGESRANGIFHFAGAGEASWADFAELLFAEAALRGRRPVRVQRISTAQYPTPARRPANSRLDTAKIEAMGIVPASWHDGVRKCLDTLLG